jgi:hypothetical protein
MTETRTTRSSLRKVAPLAAAGCAALVASVAAGRRRARRSSRRAADPAHRHLANEEMEALATGEGMPEARED